MLGGGLEPGTLTVVHGTTGVGKTQLGLSFLNAGLQAEEQRGVLVDLTTRGDSQQHAEYARRLFGWEVVDGSIPKQSVFTPPEPMPNRFTGLDYQGKPVTRANLTDEEWRIWSQQLAIKMEEVTAFMYAHFARGTRRVMIDGIEPSKRAEDSVQLRLIEYIYQQILRTDSDWVARSLFRGEWQRVKDAVERCAYNKDDVCTLVLQTSNEIMLTELMSREIVEGDLGTNATTILLLGRWPEGAHLGRAAFVLKNRGKRASEDVVPFTITEEGLTPL
jgi:KaiC/GvpD/RAD55 family RecA-like ATPase